jgi:hypothetical protein
MRTMIWLHLLIDEKADFSNASQSQVHNLKDKIYDAINV